MGTSHSRPSVRKKRLSAFCRACLCPVHINTTTRRNVNVRCRRQSCARTRYRALVCSSCNVEVSAAIISASFFVSSFLSSPQSLVLSATSCYTAHANLMALGGGHVDGNVSWRPVNWQTVFPNWRFLVQEFLRRHPAVSQSRHKRGQ